MRLIVGAQKIAKLSAAIFLQTARYWLVLDMKRRAKTNSILEQQERSYPAMAISRPPFCLALVAVAALLVSSCCHAASGSEHPVESSKMVVIQDDPKCEVMERCSVDNCTAYCVSIGLQQIGFCTFRDLQFYCCCPI
ncbi:uncharacterized protein LOC107303391 [Oryza brachyantha]|uniref:uncharacterized protein LOC107303391 n=1 Tax=Oryza brachyantha TaxID=4533 RepID=UPI0007760F97|nr:uncharacterized protein LOC107303391 [Oryza brachyantha]